MPIGIGELLAVAEHAQSVGVATHLDGEISGTETGHELPRERRPESRAITHEGSEAGDGRRPKRAGRVQTREAMLVETVAGDAKG